jgi:FeS assembly SUF system protein
MSEIENEPITQAASQGEGTTPASAAEGSVTEDRVIDVLKTCFDPEIPVNIYELGLVYGISINPEGRVDVTMTLTTPACPVAGSLPGEVEAKIRSLPGVRDVKVDLVWDPVWNPNMMTEAARLQLGFTY